MEFEEIRETVRDLVFVAMTLKWFRKTLQRWRRPRQTVARATPLRIGIGFREPVVMPAPQMASGSARSGAP